VALQQKDTKAHMRAGGGDACLDAAKSIKPDALGSLLNAFTRCKPDIFRPRQHAVDRCHRDASGFGKVWDLGSAHLDHDPFRITGAA
jgi:succinylarginine dihydrolase